jgi:DedD protein
MRSLLDDEVEDKASEITLSTASLLGIFFGLVLVCGVFFGFGYSMGRGTQSTKPGSASASNNVEPDETATAQNSVPPAAAPAQAEEQQADLPVRAKATLPPVAHAKADAAADLEIQKTEAPRAPARKPSAALEAALEQPAAVAASMSAPSGTGQPMVQIAAVARREDADVLVSALRQRGYGVVVRNEPQDKLLHVQVGPFADRTQATVVKQKLLSDGYNAIIKQ